MILCLNGAYIEEEQACIMPSDRGFTLSDGVFDTMLAVDGELVFAAEHFTRLSRHAAALQISLPFSPETLRTMATELLKKNDFNSDRHAIRTTLTRGPAPRGLMPPQNQEPTFLMQAHPAPAPETLPPVHAIVATTTRRNEFSPLSQIKCPHYGDALLVLQEARNKGANEAILLNTKGNVACGTASNLFIFEDGRFITPPLADGVMDGVMRAHLLAEGLAAEDHISLARLRAAKAICLTNSIIGIRPVQSLDGVKLAEIMPETGLLRYFQARAAA